MIVARTIIDKKEWEDFVLSRPEANFLHSWYWGELHERLGKKIARVGFFDGSKLVGVLLAVVENARRARYVTVPGGAIIDWENKEVVASFVEQIKQLAQATKSAFIRVRPQLVSSDFSKKLFKEYGFRPSPMHLHAELTHQLDITKTQDELLASMRKATRYEIRRAEKLGVRITVSSDPHNVRKFYELQLETARRQKFVPFSYKFLHEQFKVFSETNLALLYSAHLEDKLLAQAFVIFYGQEAVYHYGASTDEGRKFPGAYLIQWEAIKEAKARGMRRYNFWGVAPEGKQSHRFAGLSLFKRGFGGEDVEYLHAQDLVINYPRYTINFLLEEARKILRRV